MTKASDARQDFALELYQMRGYSYDRVAREEDPARPGHQLYANGGNARTAVLAALARATGMLDPTIETHEPEREPSPEEIRSLIFARHETIITAWMPKATKGDANAARIVRDALAAQAALYGANTRPAPARAGARRAGGEVDEVDDLATRRARRRAVARGTAPAAPADAT